MKKAIVLLSLLALSCVRKESVPTGTAQPATETTTVAAQPSDALDSATINKLVLINPAEPWNNAKGYKAGEVVIFNNETWIAIRPGYQNTPPPDEWFWKKVIVTGTQPVAQAGQVVNVQPAQQVAQPATQQPAAQTVTTQPASATPYDMNREYKAGETVSFNGKNFIARRAVFLNTNPSDNWFWTETK